MLIRTRSLDHAELQQTEARPCCGHHVGPLDLAREYAGRRRASAKPTIGNMIGATIASKSAGEEHDPQRPEREELLLADQGADPDEQQATEDPAEAPEHRGDPPGAAQHPALEDPDEVAGQRVGERREAERGLEEEVHAQAGREPEDRARLGSLAVRDGHGRDEPEVGDDAEDAQVREDRRLDRARSRSAAARAGRTGSPGLPSGRSSAARWTTDDRPMSASGRTQDRLLDRAGCLLHRHDSCRPGCPTGTRLTLRR